ncbi:MAG: M20/M25/M40 family metallo-hydrolase [Pseudolysinimonas sp.]
MLDVGEAAVTLTAELVAVDSVNPALVPDAAGEAAIVEHLRVRLDSRGFVTHVIPSADGSRLSLVAVPPGPEGAPTVVLNGHLDTVGVSGMDDPFTPQIDGDRLYGRGAADMKGGVAALVVAAERLVASGAHVRPVLALVADEEDASRGSEAVIAALPALHIRPDVCLIAEPTDLTLARSLRGFAVVEVEFSGIAAHSSQPELGVDAIRHLGAFLSAIENRAVQIREAGGDLMVTRVEGGGSPFIVADRARCVVERRTGADESAEDAIDEVRHLLRPEWRATARSIVARGAWRLGGGSAAILADRLADALGTTADFEAPYWMEAPLWEQLCPTLICGPSGGGLHAVDEWVDLEQVRRFARGLVHVLSSQDAAVR